MTRPAFWPKVGDELELKLNCRSYVKRKCYEFEKGWKGKVLAIDYFTNAEGEQGISLSGLQVDFGRRKEHGRRDNSITWISKEAFTGFEGTQPK